MFKIKIEEIKQIKEVMEQAEECIGKILGCRVTLSMELMQEQVSNTVRIIKTVSITTGVSELDICGSSKITPVLFARYFAIKLFKKYLKTSLTAIGTVFNRDHSTIISALKTFDDLYLTNKTFRQGFDDCERAFIGDILS